MPRTLDATATEARAPREPPPTKLAALLAEGPIPIGRARQIGESLARALVRHHAAGRVLGDLEPSRIAISSGDGVVRAEIREPERTEPVEAVPPAARYIAPEQVQSHAVSAACDIYTLGVILFEMVAGVAPIHGQTPVEVMIRKTITDAPPLSQVCPVTPSYAVLVDACLARDPTRRPRSAAEVAARLVEDGRPRATVELASQPRRGATVVVASRPRPRVRPDFAALVLAVGVAVAALVYAFMDDDESSPWGERVRGNLLAPVSEPAN